MTDLIVSLLVAIPMAVILAWVGAGRVEPLLAALPSNVRYGPYDRDREIVRLDPTTLPVRPNHRRRLVRWLRAFR